MHAEMDVIDSVVMVGPSGGRPECKSPKSLDGSVTQSIYVYVDDVDAHHAQARDAGAEIIAELEDKFYGDRVYEAKDLEGHRWAFGQHVKDVPLDQMQP